MFVMNTGVYIHTQSFIYLSQVLLPTTSHIFSPFNAGITSWPQLMEHFAINYSVNTPL